MIRIHRKGYVRSDGVRVKPTNYLARDRGAPGRTPESKKFFRPRRRLALEGTGEWHADLSPAQRRRVLSALVKRRGYATVVRELNALRNVSTSRTTDAAAEADMNYLRRRYRGG